MPLSLIDISMPKILPIPFLLIGLSILMKMIGFLKNPDEWKLFALQNIKVISILNQFSQSLFNSRFYTCWITATTSVKSNKYLYQRSRKTHFRVFHGRTLVKSYDSFVLQLPYFPASFPSSSLPVFVCSTLLPIIYPSYVSLWSFISFLSLPTSHSRNSTNMYDWQEKLIGYDSLTSAQSRILKVNVHVTFFRTSTMFRLLTALHGWKIIVLQIPCSFSASSTTTGFWKKVMKTSLS